jgi:phenylalanyl-tRNA synthetase beta chain
MRLVLSWLRDFVDINVPAEDIAGTLGLRGFEVAAIEKLDGPDGNDAVIDFEITANRPDCLNVLGLAREVATAFQLPLRLPAYDGPIPLLPLPVGESDRLSIIIEDEDLCPRYAGALAEVRPGPSPEWLVRRLEAAGVSAINNIVDITNYVNVELGQPMHAFDAARIVGPEIRVRRARPGETIRTLDEVDRRLEPDMLVIADRDRAQAIAGVMGGDDSKVRDSTRAAIFESAYFKPASVRRTSKRLGLKTEASTRFERGADIDAQVTAIERAAALMARVGAGRIVGPVVDRYPHALDRRRTIRLRRSRLERLLGTEVPDQDVVRILTALGMVVHSVKDGLMGAWQVVVPTFRVDILREVDLIEEVGRHFGFDRLPATFPAMRAPAPPPDPRVPRDQLVRRVLTGAGLSEAVTFGFIEARAAETFLPAGAATPVAIANPLSAKFDTLRPSLIPGLVDAVANNRHHGRRDVRLFEIGSRFGEWGERRGVALAWTGAATPEHWSGGLREVDFFDGKGVIEQLCAALGVTVRTESAREPFLVPGRTAAVLVDLGPSKDARVGVIGELSPAVADRRGLPRQDRVIVGELDLDHLERACFAASDATRPLPRYPFVVRDVSIVVSDTLPAATIRGTIQAAVDDQRSLAARLVGIGFFDRYQGKGVPEGRVSLSARLTFQSDDRTLTDAEVQQSLDAILVALVREHAAVQR